MKGMNSQANLSKRKAFILKFNSWIEFTATVTFQQEKIPSYRENQLIMEIF